MNKTTSIYKKNIRLKSRNKSALKRNRIQVRYPPETNFSKKSATTNYAQPHPRLVPKALRLA
jgi:hypothetical protein